MLRTPLRPLVLVSLTLFACASGPVPAPVPEAIPDHPDRVVLVSVDTLRADALGSYGASQRTPHLDRLAARGVRFETAIAPTPLTLPSHASLLTGLDPSHHGVHTNSTFRLDARLPTLAERFQAAGYATAGFVAAVVLDRRYGLARGFDHYDDEMGYRRTTRSAGGLAERRADEVVDAVLAWLETAPDRFFLWVHLYDPHANYDPPDGFRPTGRAAPAAPDADFIARAAAAVRPLYEGEVRFVDQQLGRLFEAIARRGPDDTALVAVTSDHGESLGEHGELSHSLTLYDATQRVPLLLAGAGLPAGRVVDAPVRLVDVAPTLLAAAGLPDLGAIQGEDLGPWIRGEREDGLDAYVETLAPQLNYGWSPLLGVRTSEHKYLRAPRPELYDLAADPDELDDRAAVDPATLARLDAMLDTRLAGAMAVRPDVSPDVEERAMLESLGYVVGATPSEALALGPVGGLDPKDGVAILAAVIEASGDLASGAPAAAIERLAALPAAGGWAARVRAEAYLALSKPSAAERAARVLVEAQPARGDGHLLLGRALEARGRRTAAAEAYAAALRIDPAQSGASTGLGRLEEARGNRDAALARYEEATKSRSPDAEAAVRLATVRFESGQPYEARLLLEQAWDAAGIPTDVRIALVRAEAAGGHPTRALRRLDSAIAAERNPADRKALKAAQAELRAPGKR